MIRERQYPDSELARISNEWLQNHFSRMKIKNTQQGSRVYFTFPVRNGEEYVLDFQTKDKTREISFGVEYPKNNLLQTLEQGLEYDSVFYNHPVLSKYRSKLGKYREVFRRKDVGQKDLIIKTKDQQGGEIIILEK